MKEWDTIYRDLLDAQNKLAEAIQWAHKLDQREQRRFAELNEDLNSVRARADAAEKAAVGYLKRAQAAEARITELEALLAAQECRPVTEPPKDNGDYLVYCWPGEYEVMTFWDGYWAGGIPVYHWQPLPAPPQAHPG